MNSAYWLFAACSEVQFEHISNKDCIKTKHFIKLTFVCHNNCVKVWLLDFPESFLKWRKFGFEALRNENSWCVIFGSVSRRHSSSCKSVVSHFGSSNSLDRII
jgi:hypothetical protein